VGLLLRLKVKVKGQGQMFRSRLSVRPSVTPFPCDKLSCLGATGLKLHTQVAYVRGRYEFTIEVKRLKVKVTAVRYTVSVQ
jgi:hypothetical protein